MFPLKGLAPLGARPFFMKLCCREGDTNWRNEMREEGSVTFLSARAGIGHRIQLDRLKAEGFLGAKYA